MSVRPDQNHQVTRVGVILGDLGKLNVSALKYLIVHLNTLQTSFELELHSIDAEDPLLHILRSGKTADREQCRMMLPDFHKRITDHLTQEQQTYALSDLTIPDGFVLITMARFSDEHYGLKSEAVQVQAFGNWERHMAPPSIFEFIIALLLRQALSFAAPSLSKSVHLGTKGCLLDFTADLSEARYKALQGYICTGCRQRLKNDGVSRIADEVMTILKMDWLGKPSDTHSPAGIVAKLGYNLFLTQGISPTWREALRAGLRDEGTKELIKLIGAVILAALLVWLGLKAK